MLSSGAAILQGVTISAHSIFTASDNTNTTLLGVIDNLGSIDLIGGNRKTNSSTIGNAVTLTGGGAVMLDTNQRPTVRRIIQGNGQTLTQFRTT